MLKPAPPGDTVHYGTINGDEFSPRLFVVGAFEPCNQAVPGFGKTRHSIPLMASVVSSPMANTHKYPKSDTENNAATGPWSKIVNSRTIMVIMLASTPSLNASRHVAFMKKPGNGDRGYGCRNPSKHACRRAAGIS